MHEKLLNQIKNLYCEIHAIYEPEGSGIYGDCHYAAVDLFAPGLTFRLYFQVENEQISIRHAERWHFG